MKSLRLRFTLVAGISIAIAVGATGFSLARLFNNHLETELRTELEYQLEQLTNSIRLIDAERLAVDGPTDPKFEDPLSGRYWQARVAGGEVALSPSLWNERFEFLKVAPPPGRIVHQIQSRPDEAALSIAQWHIVLQRDNKDIGVDVAVAADRKAVTAAMAEFRMQLALWLSILGLALLLAAIAQILLGLSPMETLRRKVERIKSGAAARLTGQYPSEVTPLVDEVNELLDQQDETLRQARARAGDLAHGLKTPITILSAIAREVRKAGHNKAGDDIEEQISAMDGHVQRELNRARLAAQFVVNCDLVPDVHRVANTNRKIPGDKTIDWRIELPEKVEVPIDRQDLSEVVGNVLDNARKWTRSAISVSASLDDDQVIMCIEDDGDGVAEDDFAKLTTRGQRLNHSAGGSGLGLSIAEDITTAYRGELSFYSAALGGLGVRLAWPHRRPA